MKDGLFYRARTINRQAVKMQIRYFTQKGSIYTFRNGPSGGAGVWTKQGRDGLFQPLAGALHLPRTRLQELLREYPTSARDSTVCFGNGLAREFFDDVEREHITDIPDGQETNIFFIIKKAEGRFTLGYSSVVERIEKTE